jgi:uncharacterized SAM-binding protein YcdF (DUF218 family)
MLKLFKRLAAALLVLGVLLVASYVFRAPLLRASADFWIVNQSVTNTDSIVVLGGGLQTRPFFAAKLFQEGLATRILLMNVKPDATTELGLTPTEQELTRKVLLSQGMTETNLVEIGNRVSSSYEESLAVRNWVKQTGARRIIIPTDLFHTRRVRWLYAKELDGLNVEVIVVAVPQREYTASDWWQHEEGLIAFQNEVIKFAYYRLKY